MDQVLQKILVAALVAAVFLYGVNTYLNYKALQLRARENNMRAFSEMIRCDDAPTDVAKCEEAFGKFFVKEYGLFDKKLIEMLER